MTQTKIQKNAIQTISTSELAERLANGVSFRFWNVLTDEYFSGEMIPGSKRVALDQIGRFVHDAKDEDLTGETEIVVYCAGPECPQSRAAAEKLRDYGFTNVLAYEGGLEEWKQAGHAVENI